MQGQIEKADKRRWWVLLALFLITFINYFDRQTLGCAIEPICEEFGLSLAERGKLLSAFITTYAIAHLFVGFLTDRIKNIRRFFSIFVVAWSLSTILVGFVDGYGQILGLRYLLGVFEAVNFPVCLLIISRIFPAKERTLASGIFGSGGFLATLAAPKFTIYFSTEYTWRYAFIIAGILGFFWLILWFSVYKENGTVGKGEISGALDLRSWASSFLQVVKTPAFWGVTALGIGIVPCLYFCTQWLPSYFIQELHQPYDMNLANKLTVIYLFQDMGMWASGVLVMWLSSRMSLLKARKRVIGIGYVLMMSCVLLFFVKNPWANVWIFAAFIFGMGLCLANQHAFKQDVLPGNVATVSALVGFSETLFTSFVLSRIGVAVQSIGDYSITIWILIVCATFALLASVLLLRSRWLRLE